MKKIILTILLAALTFPTFAGVKVIVHPSNDSNFDKRTIEKFFLGKKKIFSNGAKAVLLTLPDSSKTTEEFNSSLLGKDTKQLKAYWSKLVFTGKATPPREMASEEQMVEFISDNPNTIGFVSSDSPTNGVKVIAEF